eukprot:4036732-Pyramimonas_sp.AAC.1
MRLEQAGTEDQVPQPQRGFSRGRGAANAIREVRRHIELAHARKNAELYMMPWTRKTSWIP